MSLPQGTLNPNSGNMNTRQLLSNSVYTRSLSNSCGRIGPPGPPGATGPKGELGLTGDEGVQGSKGQKGEIGIQGLLGPRGLQGLKGPQGSQGIQGEKGDRGPTGITGPEGPKGPVGPTGPQGIQGFKGEQGDKSVGSLDASVSVGATTDQPVFFSEININTLEAREGTSIDIFGGYLQLINQGNDQMIQSRYADRIYIGINGVTFNGDGIITSKIVSTTGTITNGLTVTGGLFTNGSSIDTRSSGSVTGTITAGGLITAISGVSTNSLDTLSALTIGTSATSITIGKSGTTTSIVSALSCNNITGTNYSILSGVGTFSGITCGVADVASIKSTSFTVSSGGLGTFSGVTCSGGITSSTLTTGAITGTNVTASGTGTFSGVTCSGGLTVGSIFNPNFSISSAGAANVASVSTGNITSTGTITNVSNNYSITNLGAATFENVTCNSTMLCKSQVTLRASTNTSVMAMDTGLGGTFGIFSRKNGVIINTSTLSIALSSIVYDSIYTLPMSSSLTTSTIILPPEDVSKFSPLRFFIHNNHATITINVTSTLSNIWGPATGGSSATTSFKIPPSKRVSVTLMTTDSGYIASDSTLLYHYFVMYDNNPNSIDTATVGGTVSVGVNNASNVVIGNASSTTTLSGTVTINDPLYNYYTPVGTIVMYAGKTTPSGYLFCNGDLYSSTTTTYVPLFNAIGFYYGQSGTSFRVPDLKDKFPRGSTLATLNTGVAVAVGTTTGGSFTISSSQLPAHSHPVSLGIHWNEQGVNTGNSQRLTSIDQVSPTISFSGTANSQSGTIGQPYYQPFTIIGYIIKY